MANEFQLLPNPTNVPESIEISYQRQNTNIFVLQTGLDTTEPYDNGTGTITIPEGGIIEINGVMYKITSNIILSKPNANIAYWISINKNENGTGSAELVTRPGIYDNDKKGCYLNDGRRTLNWVSLGNLNNLVEPTFFSGTTKNKYEIILPISWYWADLKSGNGLNNSVSVTKSAAFFNKNNLLTIFVGGNAIGGGTGERSLIVNIVDTGNTSGSSTLGIDGWDMPDGSAGGYCNIYKLGN